MKRLLLVNVFFSVVGHVCRQRGTPLVPPLTNQTAQYVVRANTPYYIYYILISFLHYRIRMLKQGSKLFHQRQAALACQKRLFACPGSCSKGGCGPSKTTKAFSSLNHNEVSRHSSEIEAVLHLQPRILTAATIKPTVETRKVSISIHKCVVRSYTKVTSQFLDTTLSNFPNFHGSFL